MHVLRARAAPRAPRHRRRPGPPAVRRPRLRWAASPSGASRRARASAVAASQRSARPGTGGSPARSAWSGWRRPAPVSSSSRSRTAPDRGGPLPSGAAARERVTRRRPARATGGGPAGVGPSTTSSRCGAAGARGVARGRSEGGGQQGREAPPGASRPSAAARGRRGRGRCAVRQPLTHSTPPAPAPCRGRRPCCPGVGDDGRADDGPGPGHRTAAGGPHSQAVDAAQVEHQRQAAWVPCTASSRRCASRATGSPRSGSSSGAGRTRGERPLAHGVAHLQERVVADRRSHGGTPRRPAPGAWWARSAPPQRPPLPLGGVADVGAHAREVVQVPARTSPHPLSAQRPSRRSTCTTTKPSVVARKRPAAR